VSGAGEALAQLQSSGLGLVVVTNQSGIGRGYFDLNQLTKIHDRLRDLLAAEGVRLDGIYFCPHQPDENCNCRKPATGMIERAAKELDFDPADSFVVGDNVCDIELGQRAGATTILVRTGYGEEVAARRQARPNFVVDDITEASSLINTLIQKKNYRQGIAI